MADLDAIAAARATAQAVETEARALGDQLAAAKRERRLLRRELQVLPPRIATARQALADARAAEQVAAQARAAAAAQAESAADTAEVAEAAAAGADADVAAAQDEMAAAMSEVPRPPVALIRAMQRAIQQAAAAAAAAQRSAATARAAANQRAATLATADAALRAATADATAKAAQLAELEAALAAAEARSRPVEARPGELTVAITDARERVRAAWEPWTALLRVVHEQLDVAARARAAADEQLALARLAAAQARDALDGAERSGDAPAVQAARAAVEQRDADVTAASTALGQAAADLDGRRRDLIGKPGADDLVSLVAADVPLALLPVRLETRLEPRGNAAQLLLRVYPDSLHACSHEPELTPEEVEWGTRFLAAEESNGDGAAWRLLADRFGAPRAAWIARAVSAGESAGRAAAWTRAPATAALPDRWIVLGYRDGQRRFVAVGRPIADSVVLGPDPSAPASDDPIAALGEEARWLVDFDRAVEAGMALRIDLGPQDAGGLDRVVVLGVRATGDAEDGARRLGALLDGHRYTDGLGLAAPGTPTNNTASARSGWSASVTARAAAPVASDADGTDGGVLARALGIDHDVIAELPHAGAVYAAEERAMATALWPATWGYMLEQLAGPLTEEALTETRAHVLGHVRAQGPLPVLRAGSQPYGLLPATSLERLSLLDPADLDAVAPALLRALAPAWRAAAGLLPRITPDTPLDDPLVAALAMSPVSVGVAARGLALQPATGFGTFSRRQSALEAVRALGLDVDPALARAGFEAAAGELTGPLAAEQPSETEPLTPGANYVAWLADSGLEAVRGGSPPGGANTLLFALLRHSLLREYAATAVRIVRVRGLAQPGEGIEAGLGPDAPSPWARLAAPLEGVMGTATLAEHLDAARAGGSPATAQLAPLLELQASLRALAGIPTARLARLLAGTLDVASHRLDAWIAAHAGRRLAALREQRPTGARLGGYGVVEDLRPFPQPPGGRVAELEAELAAAQARAASAQQAVAAADAALAAARTRVRDADAHVASLESQLAAAHEALADLQAEGDFAQVKFLARRISQLETQLRTARTAAQQALSGVAPAEAAVPAARSAATAATADVARVDGLLAEARAARPEPIELAHNQGHVHAPSLGQAATAAVLRSGHLAHRSESDSPFAVDLSSLRVRVALQLLDGVRAGQSLGALLGYRFERGLHEGHSGLDLDRHIFTLRGLAPLDDVTKAEFDLAQALRREADVTARVGALEAQLAAARQADQQTKDALRAQLTAAQAERAAAQSAAQTAAEALEQIQSDLQTMLDDAAGGEPSPIPAWKFGENDASAGWISPAQRAAIRQRARAMAGAETAFNDAARRATDAERRIAELSAGLAVVDPTIASLEQAVTELQAELEAARAAVAAAQARLDELGGPDDGPATEAIRARNVADGLALRSRWRTGIAESRWDITTIPFGDAELELPPLGSAEQQAIDAELRTVDDAVDALGDLLLAESVHQLVQGNPLRAGATLDALSRGDAAAPEVEVVRTPRGGTAVTHRLVVLVDPDAEPTGWPTDTAQVRATVEPALEAWAAGVLGPAERVRARVRYGAETAELDLSVLRLSALDVVAMAVAGSPAGATELELRLLDHAAQLRPDAEVTLELDRDPSWTPDQLSLAELLEVARELRELIAGARALDGRDLALPGERDAPGVDEADLEARASVALAALAAARSALASAADPAARRAALLRASMLGVPGSIPGTGDELPRCAAVLRELERRAGLAEAAEGARERIAAVLGEDFRMLGRVVDPNPELALSLAASEALQGGDELAAVTWMQRAAHVREGVARLEGALLYAEATESPERLDLRVAQLPHRAGDRWAALPQERIEGGRLSIVAQMRGPSPQPGRPLAGLLVDEWSEVIPDRTQMTGLSFHFDQPGSRAPQAILLAVPPTEERLWSLATLEAVVLETLDLARLRLVDPDALSRPILGSAVPRLGHYLPAAYVATEPAADTVTTDLGLVSA